MKSACKHREQGKSRLLQLEMVSGLLSLLFEQAEVGHSLVSHEDFNGYYQGDQSNTRLPYCQPLTIVANLNVGGGF